MSAWEQVVEMMTRTQTPVQSATQLFIYVFFVLMGVALGWLLHKVRNRR